MMTAPIVQNFFSVGVRSNGCTSSFFGEAYQLGDAVHAMHDVLIAHADLARTEFEFLADAFQKQLIVGILKDIAHAARPFGGAALIDVNAINQHFASGGAQNAVEMLDQRGLPCTVLPYDRHRRCRQRVKSTPSRALVLRDRRAPVPATRFS